MEISRIRLLAGTAAWLVRRRAAAMKDRLQRALNWVPRVHVRVTSYGLETAALMVAYLAMAGALLALLGMLLTGGQA